MNFFAYFAFICRCLTNCFWFIKFSPQFQLEKKLALKLLIIIVIWVAAWTPLTGVAVLQMTGYGHHVSHWHSLFALIMTKLSSVINSFIYGMRFDLNFYLTF
jgi:hypothetical protein